MPGDPRTVVERGAEFMLDGYDLMRAVAGELGLRLADTAMSYYEREPRGGAAITHLQTARCAQYGVRVLIDDGEVHGDAVIVAVPMAVLPGRA